MSRKVQDSLKILSVWELFIMVQELNLGSFFRSFFERKNSFEKS